MTTRDVSERQSPPSSTSDPDEPHPCGVPATEVFGRPGGNLDEDDRRSSAGEGFRVGVVVRGPDLSITSCLVANAAGIVELMLSRALSRLSRLSLVRVTVGYATMLVAVATALLVLGPRVEEAVVSDMSTNLHNLARGHFATLIGSVFVTSSGFIYVWLPGLVCLLALAELFWRSGRLILAFGLGHVGATLVVAFGLAAAIQFDLSPMSVARASDVGISYGALAVLGTLTAAIPARWRPGWIGWWLAVALLAVVAEDDFANAGHLVALIIGMALSVRFSPVTQWTPVRCVLLTIGAAFCYLVLANELSPVTAPIAGLLGALIGRWMTHRWLSRRLRLPASPGLIAVNAASR